MFSCSLVDGLKSVTDVLSEEPEVRLEQRNGITDNLDLIIALLTALSVVNVLLVTVGESLIVLILLLVAADLGVVLLSFGSVDALGECVDFALELVDFGGEGLLLFAELVEGRGVLLKLFCFKKKG